MPTFGNATLKTTNAAGQNGYLFAFKHSLTEAGKIDSISLYVLVAAGNIRLAIYSDSAGSPGALLCQTASQTAVEGWNTLIPTTLPTLAAGTYWLAFQVSSATLQIRYQAGAANQRAYRTFTYNAFPDPFGTPTLDAYTYSIYATYTLPVVGGYAAIF